MISHKKTAMFEELYHGFESYMRSHYLAVSFTGYQIYYQSAILVRIRNVLHDITST